MPQCICGVHFTITSYDPYNKDNDICPRCRASSTPKSYVSSYSWDGGVMPGVIPNFDKENTSDE